MKGMKKMKGKLGLANGSAKKGAVNRGVSRLEENPKILPVINKRDMSHEAMIKKMVGKIMGADHNGM